MDVVRTEVGLRFAVVGCSHGALDLIYQTVSILEQQGGYIVDAILCCGDFQAIRNAYDLDTMVAPNKYKKMEDFWRYYSGEKVAPRLTIFIGGNHEAVAHSRELYYGGWAAPNIYFLGYSGLIDVGGVKIAGFSGIYKSEFFKSGHYEMSPYNFERARKESKPLPEENGTISCLEFYFLNYLAFHHLTDRSLSLFNFIFSICWAGNDKQAARLRYKELEDLHSSHYVRLFELWKLAHIGGRVRPDIMMSHDWPEFIAHYGHKDTLLRMRPQFKKSVDSDSLGAQPYLKLLRHLQPRFWLSGHMHVKYTATVQHANNPTNPNSQTGKLEDLAKQLQAQETQNVQPICPKHPVTETEFLALDKPLPGREFVDVIHLPFASGERETEVILNECGEPLPASPLLRHDLDWLAIIKASHDYFPNHKGAAKVLPQLHPNAINKARAWIVSNCLDNDQFNSDALRIAPSSFIRSAEIYVEGQEPIRTSPVVSPQTEAFLRWLDLDMSKLEHVEGVRVNSNKEARSKLASQSSIPAASSSTTQESASPK